MMSVSFGSLLSLTTIGFTRWSISVYTILWYVILISFSVMEINSIFLYFRTCLKRVVFYHGQSNLLIAHNVHLAKEVFYCDTCVSLFYSFYTHNKLFIDNFVSHVFKTNVRFSVVQLFNPTSSYCSI